MAHKELKYDADARRALEQGVDEAIVAEAPEKEAAGAGAGMPDMSGMM